MRVAFLGPAGTFGEVAALKLDPEAEMVPCASHAAVAAAVESGEADVGVLAIENSLNGSVAETLDILIHDTDLKIQGEIVVPVVHNLVGAPGTRLEDIRVVYSHPQALGQCRHFLERELPHAQVEAALSTAGAVGMALAHGAEAAAISTERAAELHGGAILARAIQDADNNVTRFVVVGRGMPPPTGRDRTSIAFTFAEEGRPGSLAGVLNEFGNRQINCTKMESRPTKEVFGAYVFLIDFEGHAEEPLGREVLEAIRPLCATLKVFGSYPRWN
jgi:prephenate dehydratase